MKERKIKGKQLQFIQDGREECKMKGLGTFNDNEQEENIREKWSINKGATKTIAR